MFNLQPQLWNGAPTQFLTFTSSNATITPAITLSGDGPCQWEVTEADGAKYYYSTNSFSHTRSVAGNMTVRLLNTMQVAPYVTQINFSSDGIVSINNLVLGVFRNNTYINIGSNGTTGIVDSSIFTPLINTIWFQNNFLTGNWENITIPPETIILSLGTNNFTGDLSTKTLPATTTDAYLSSCAFTGLCQVPNPTSIKVFQGQNQGATNMTQPRIDAFVTAWYAQWVAGAFSANCTVNIGGTNADPSGIYQNPFPNPPATPLEMVYVMVNDPFGTGNKTQVWTY